MNIILQENLQKIQESDLFEYEIFKEKNFSQNLKNSLKYLKNNENHAPEIQFGFISNFFQHQYPNQNITNEFNYCYIYFLDKIIKKASYSHFYENHKDPEGIIIKNNFDNNNNFPPQNYPEPNQFNYSILTLIVNNQLIQAKCHLSSLNEARQNSKLHDSILTSALKNNLEKTLKELNLNNKLVKI